MKRILIALALLTLLPSLAFGQAKVMRNDTPAAIGCENLGQCAISVDSKGQIMTTAVDGSGGIYAEDSAHVTAELGNFILGVSNEASNTLCATSGDYCPIATNKYGSLVVDVNTSATADVTKSILKLEDAAHVTGDAGVMCLFKQTHTLAPSAADGDYSVPNIDGNGRVYVNPIRSNQCIDVQLTITADEHAAGESLGGKLTLAGASQSGATMTRLVSLALGDDEGSNADVTILWFDTDPTNSTFTDSAAVTVHDDDLDDLACTVHVTDHTSFAANGVSVARNIGCAWRPTTTNSFAVILMDETITYTATDGLHLKACFERD